MTASTNRPVLFGAPSSVYVRAARLALDEKGVDYELVPVDIFTPVGPSPEHLARHPFGKIPSFEHAGFRFYEFGAITRYVDEAFPGPPLQPAEARARARMNQVISIVDSYVYRTLVWDIYVARVSRPASGSVPDEEKIAAALPRAEVCLAALEELLGEAPWLAGPAITLADLHTAPMFARFRTAPEGQRLLNGHRRLAGWWERISARPSFVWTEAPPRAVWQGG
jgi:glutathione S-transferase